MGINERKTREKQELKKKIIDTSLEIAKRDGWPSLTIRRIAEHMEYSTTVIYKHFHNKESLLSNIRADGFKYLLNRLVRINNSIPAKEKLIQIGMNIWKFACKNNELYQVMYNLGGININCSQTDEMSSIQEMVRANIEQITTKNIECLYLNFWCLLHGFISYKISYWSLSKTARMEECLQDSLFRFSNHIS